MIYNIRDEYRFGSDIKTFKKIPVNNYIVLQDEYSKEFYLKTIDSFTLPKKIYGKEEEIADRYLKSFNKSNKNMGVLLTGLKGSGKTLLAKILSEKSKLPVILVTQPFSGEDFQDFLSSLKQKVIVLVDEFEKVYADDEKQQQLLPVLDGVFETKIMFILTSNTLNVNEFLKNRPGRIRYLRQYDGLEKDTMNEIIDDLLEDKEKKNELIDVLNILSSVSIDVLLHLIQEMNDYDETAKESIRHLNIQVEHTTFDVRMYINNKLHYSKVNYNPLTSKYIYLTYKYQDDRDPSRDRWGHYERDTDEMTIQCINGEFEFKDRDGNKIVFTPSKPFQFSIS